MPTLWFDLAYTSVRTRRWDVDFHVDRTPRTSEQLYQHLLSLKQKALEDNVRLLEFTVYSGEREIWRGMV
jgi:hypothetical protein